jgi:signal transduction histidine kinase/CheY-like chemotaxis protein
MANLENIEKRDWQLWILTIVFIAILCSFIAALVFYSDVKEIFQDTLTDFSFNILFIGFLGLSLLFLSYIVTKELFIKKLRHNLSKEQVQLAERENQFRKLKALFEISCLVSSQVELNQIFNAITENIVHCLGADQSSLMLFNPSIQKLRCESAFGLSRELIVGKEVNLGKSVAGWVMEHNQPLLLNKGVNGYDFSNLVEKSRVITSALCVPLRIKGDAKGVLNVNIIDREKKFDEVDLQLLSIFAESATIAIEKASLLAELKQKANELIESERLRTIGELSGGIAHELNNLLNVVMNRIQLLQDFSENEGFKRNIEAIEKSVSDAAEIVQRLQEFAGKISEKNFVNIDINSIINDVLEITKPQWNELPKLAGIQINLVKELNPLPPVFGSPVELREVLMNLLFNAIDALPQGGIIQIRSFREKENIFLSVSDNGLGMTEEVQEKIFEPFFTTKSGSRTGLGLSVSQSIVCKHSGEILVQSKPKKGSTFLVKLPIASIVSKEIWVENRSVLDKSLKILLIEDREDVREGLKELLTTDGHWLKVTSRGEEGINLLKHEGFDLVITDMGMEGMTGWDVAKEAKKINPQMPVMGITGWGPNAVTKSTQDSGIDLLLNKPIKKKEIQEALVKLMEGKEKPSKKEASFLI